MMPDREKVIKDLDELYRLIYQSNVDGEILGSLHDALALLKEQDKRYAMMVVDWLRDIAHNNYLDSSHMTFLDAILDIRERAQTGLENYFRDYDSDTKRQEGR